MHEQVLLLDIRVECWGKDVEDFIGVLEWS